MDWLHYKSLIIFTFFCFCFNRSATICTNLESSFLVSFEANGRFHEPPSLSAIQALSPRRNSRQNWRKLERRARERQEEGESGRERERRLKSVGEKRERESKENSCEWAISELQTSKLCLRRFHRPLWIYSQEGFFAEFQALLSFRWGREERELARNVPLFTEWSQVFSKGRKTTPDRKNTVLCSFFSWTFHIEAVNGFGGIFKILEVG